MISKIKIALNSDLRKRFGVRSFPVSAGDIVKVKSGKRRGEGGKVLEVDHAAGRVSVEGITIAKEDGKQTALFLKPEDLMLTKLDFSREERIQKLRKIASIKKITIEEPKPEEITPPGEPSEVEAEAKEIKEADTLESSSEESAEPEESEESTEDESESEEDDQ